MRKSSEISVVIFGTQWFPKSVILAEAAIKLSLRIPDLRIQAICDASEGEPHPWPVVIAGRALRRIFDSPSTMPFRREATWSLSALARRYRIPFLRPTEGSVNNRGFVEALKRMRPTLALAVGCPQVFGKDLLGAFATSVNCHSGALPEYRGFAATQWSIYNGEPRSGYSFHYMTEGVDDGLVLLADSVPVGDSSLSLLEYDKAKSAAFRLEAVLDAIRQGDEGRPQIGEPANYGRRRTRRMMDITDPSSISWQDLNRRIRAFGAIRTLVAGKTVAVTRVRRIDDDARFPSLHGLSIADGVVAVPTRFGGLPYGLHRVARAVLAQPSADL